MEFNEQQNSIYADPNAYIQNWNNQIAASNNGYLNNIQQINQKNQQINQQSNVGNAFVQNFSFKPQNCNETKMCSPKKIVFQQPYENIPNFYLNNDFKKGNCSCVPKPKPKPKPHCPPQNFDFNFDLKNLLPLLSGLLKGGGTSNFGNIISMLNNSSMDKENANSNLDLSSLINTFSSGGFSNILNLFKPKQNSNIKNDIKSTDFEIKNYTRVE